MTPFAIQPQPVPLRWDDSGALRVGNTRVLLELVLEAYLDGAPPEMIVQWFESLSLADVYAVLSYYWSHQEEITDYLRQRDELAADVRHTIEAAQPSRPNFREELLARRARLGNRHAPDGQ